MKQYNIIASRFVNIFGPVVWVSFQVFPFNERFNSFLDQLWLCLEHLYLVDNGLDKIIVILNLPGLHDSHTGCINDHSTFLHHLGVNVLHLHCSTCTLGGHLGSRWLRNHVHSDVVAFKLLIHRNFLVSSESWLLLVLFQQHFGLRVA